MSRRAFTCCAGTAVLSMLLVGAGCHATKKATEIPMGADKVRTTKGEMMEYFADRGGHVYLWDDDTAEVVFKHEIQKGDRVSVDPKSNMLMFNDKEEKARLDKTHRYNIYVK